jgi:signal transduction histidine kinase
MAKLNDDTHVLMADTNKCCVKIGKAQLRVAVVYTMTRTAIALWLTILSLFAGLPALSQESPEFSSAFFIDDSRTATIADAINADYMPFDGSIAQGYSTAALWLRLSIAGNNSPEDLAIVIKPAFLRRIELYDPTIKGVDAPPVLSGRDAAIEANNHLGLDSGFIIPSLPYKRDVYLRLTTTTSLTAEISIMPADRATQRGFLQGSLVAVYIAVLLSFGVWGLMAWAIRRDALYGLFALRQLFSSAHIFVYFGSLRFLLSGFLTADTRDLLYAFFACTVASVAGLFDVRLITEFGGSRRLRQAIYVILCLPAVTLPLAALGHVQTALQISSLLINLQFLLLVALTFTVNGYSTNSLGRLSLWLVRCGYLAMATVVVIPLLMYLNILGTSVPVFKLVFLHAIISTIILFGLLLIRNRQRDLAEQEARFLLSVKEAELRTENNRRIEKESFLSMLTHELRNPLSVIQLLSSSDRATDQTLRQAASDMADVLARVEQSERFDGGQIQVERSQFDLAALVAQVVQAHSVRDRVSFADPGPELVRSDPRMMQHVLENLLDNAAKYSAKDTEVHVDVLATNADGQAGVVVRVSNVVGDAGVPDPDRVFRKYYRSNGAHRKPGSGLGLFLVARWVAALGGKVDFGVSGTTADAQEAIFSVWIPR